MERAPQLWRAELFKTCVDGHVGRCSKARSNAALEKFLVEVADLVPEYEQFFAESEKIAPTGRVHYVWDWLP